MTHRLLWCALGVTASPLAGQQWNDAAALDLVAKAVERRALAVADSTLVSYTATARGVITFRADVELGSLPRSRLLKADRVEAEVYWQRPGRSKQIIRTWRDTTFFPTSIWYHRDHLGIATDDFGEAIRLGDGDEVRNVVHPFAPGGPERYDYRLNDTLAVTIGSKRLVLIGVEVRPKDVAQAAVVGRVYLDRDRLQVVRSEYSFTPASYLDRELEDITVRLERALFEDRYWLPFRQVIEIRRRSPVIRVPFRTVIRGDWEIGDHEVNGPLTTVEWRGPSVGGLTRPQTAGPAVGFDVLVDSSMAPSGRLESLRQEAMAIAKGHLLDGLPRAGFSVSRLSEVLRFNRVEGLALGAGFSWRGLVAEEVRLRVGYGFGNRRLSGRLEVTERLGRSWGSAYVDHSVVDAGELSGASGVVNSLASQELGRDLGDYVWRDIVGGSVRAALGGHSEGTLDLGWVRTQAASVVARPARGQFRPNPPLGDRGRLVGRLGWAYQRRTAALSHDTRLELGVEVGTGSGGYGRASATGHTGRSMFGGQLTGRGAVGFGSAGLPGWRSFNMGGPGTLLGFGHRSFGGRQLGLASVDWLFAVPAPSLPLGSLGKTGRRAFIGPVVGVGWTGGQVNSVPWVPSGHARFATGAAIELFDRAIRIEVGRGLGRSGRWGLLVDVSRDMWPVL